MQEQRLRKEIEKLGMEVAQKREQLQKLTHQFDTYKEPICPECGESDWEVRASFDPFKQITWEFRKIYFRCKNCEYGVGIDCEETRQ